MGNLSNKFNLIKRKGENYLCLAPGFWVLVARYSILDAGYLVGARLMAEGARQKAEDRRFMV